MKHNSLFFFFSFPAFSQLVNKFLLDDGSVAFLSVLPLVQVSMMSDHPFWQKYWFIFFVVILLIISIYVIVYWRTKGLQEKQQFENDRIRFQLETLRNQINPHFFIFFFCGNDTHFSSSILTRLEYSEIV